MGPPGDAASPGRGGQATAPDGRWATPGPSGGLAGSAVLGLGLVVLLAVFLAGSGGATVTGTTFQAEDTEDPTVGNLTKVDLTTVELVIRDDVDVDESTIDADDLVLSAGTLANVTASEDGTDATVAIEMNSTIGQDELSVSIDDNATIEDAAGNELDPVDAPTRTVDGMDGVPPGVRSLDVENGTDGTIDVEIRATEELQKLFVSVTGPESHVLDIEDFSTEAGFARYQASVEPEVAGEYRVRITKLTDLNDNDRDVSVYESIDIDGTPPDAVASIDFGASEGLVFTFDAGRSTDANAIRNVTWDFGDGSAATGERVSHRFEPGNYTVTLEVTDVHGNTGTDDVVLDLRNHNASIDAAALLGYKDVSIRKNPDGESGAAVIDVPEAAANVTTDLAVDGGRPIAAAGSVSLRSMSVTTSRDGGYSLGVQLDGPEAVGDAAGATNGSILAGMTVVHDVPEAAVRNVTFRVDVDRERLNATDRVAVFRLHNRSWNRLRTAALNGTNETARYRVESPGLSRFAVVREPAPAGENRTATPTPTPTRTPREVTVVDASLNATAIEPGASVGVSATVLNRGDRQVEFTAGLSVDGSVVDAQSISVPPGERRPVSFAYAPDESGTYAVAVNGTAAGTLEVGGDEPATGPLAVLGFLPLGLLRAIVTYVGGGLVALFLVLKALALYLGY